MIRKVGPPLNDNGFVIEEVADPVEIAASRRGHDQANRNLDWVSSHGNDLLPAALGKYVAIAGQQAFVAGTSEEACALARAAHPDDEGLLIQYVSPLKGPRIYGNRMIASVPWMPE